MVKRTDINQTDDPTKSVSSRTAVDQFLQKVAQTPVKAAGSTKGRLIFAMDATASREPTWDRACHLQSEMFDSTTDGTLSVQLCYYRGFNQFHAGVWCHDSNGLQKEMSAVRCAGGHTQISRVLNHIKSEHKKSRIQAVVFVGDAVEEDVDALCHAAGELGVMNIPLFLFHEGINAHVKNVFQQMARLSGGAYAPFDLQSATELKDLLSAVAIYATGGRQALEAFGKRSSGPVALLSRQVKR